MRGPYPQACPQQMQNDLRAAPGHQWGSPQRERQAVEFSKADAFIDELRSFRERQTGPDRTSDGARSTGGTAHVREWSARIPAPMRPLCPVLGGGAEAEVVGVDAAMGVAAVAEDGVLCVGPAKSRYDAVHELEGEQVRRDGSASGCAGEARGPEAAVSGVADPAEPGPALLVPPDVSLGFEASHDGGIVQPGAPELRGQSYGDWLSQQRELNSGHHPGLDHFRPEQGQLLGTDVERRG